MTWDAIDHSILSPSGTVSKRAGKAALERERRRLFGDGLPHPTCEQPSEKQRLLKQAKDLRDMAARGMRPRAGIKQAQALETQAADL